MTRIQGPQILPLRDFRNPDAKPIFGERTENSTAVRERYPDVEIISHPDPVIRIPVFGAEDYFFVVRRVEVIPGVFASSEPVLVRGDKIVAPGLEVTHNSLIAGLEFLPVYYASVLAT